MPDLRERVPEDEGWVPPSLGHFNLPLARHVGLVEGHLTDRIRNWFIGN